MTLDILGLSEEHSRTYATLTLFVSATAGEVATRLDAPVARVHEALEALVARHLAVRRGGTRYAAVRPAVALGALSRQVRNDLGIAEAALSELDDAYLAMHRAATPDVVLDVVNGPLEVSARLQQVQLQARSEVLSLVKAPVAVVGSTENDAEDVAVARGVEYRVVLERAMLEEEPRLVDEIHRVRAAGERVRVAARVPTKLFIVDREVALVPLGVAGEPATSAVLLGAGGLLDALVALFEGVWESAREMDVGFDEPDSMDVRMLTMLLAGLTDDAVARDLGVSTRTLQRRVRALLDLAGVETRLQLGYVMARRGWARR